MLIVLQIPDVIDFVRWSFKVEEIEPRQKDIISRESFDRFCLLLTQLMSKGKPVNSSELIRQLRLSFNLVYLLQSVIFKNDSNYSNKISIDSARQVKGDDEPLFKVDFSESSLDKKNITPMKLM